MDGNFDLVDLIECCLADRIDCLVDFDCCQIATIAVMCPVDCTFAALVDSIQTMVCLAAKMEFHWMPMPTAADDAADYYYYYYLTMFLAVPDDTHCQTRWIDCLWTVAVVTVAVAVIAVVGDFAAAAFVYCYGQIVMAANWFGAVAADYFGNHHCNRNYSMSKAALWTVIAALFPYCMVVVDLWLSPFPNCVMDVAVVPSLMTTIHAVAMAAVLLLCLANNSMTMMMTEVLSWSFALFLWLLVWLSVVLLAAWFASIDTVVEY